MANPYRGEYSVSLGGKTYKAVVSFDSLANIEDMLGSSLVLLRKARTQADMKTKEMAVILHYAIREGEGDNAPSVEELCDLILKEGVLVVFSYVIDLLTLYMGGEKALEAAADDAEKKEETKPETETS